MRIGIDIRALLDERTTGVQVYVKDLLLALFSLDQKNEYLLFTNSYRSVPVDETLLLFPNVTLKNFHYPNKLFTLAQKFLSFPRVDRMLGGVDLFFSPHWRATALSARVPLVLTFHDLSFEINPEFFSLRRQLWHKFMGFREAANAAEKIIAVSENTKTDLTEYYRVDSEKIAAIYSGISLSAEEKSPDAPLPEKFILSLGTFEPRKNLQTVLDAYEQYREQSREKLPLVLAGSSGWKSKLRIAKVIDPYVYCLENVSEQEKTFLYRRAFAFLFLSFYEGFGFPVLEAAHCGTPVISSLANSLMEIAGDFALFVSPYRSAEVTAALLALEDDPQYYARMKERGIAATQKFTWQKSAEKVLEIFADAVNY